MAADQSINITVLPADLFHLLAAELTERLDFGTLFNLICSSKQLANAGAITALYKISHYSPIKGGGQDLSLAEQELTVQRWSIFWRTITLSALGRTLYPYCKHLRFLDLRDLGNLLDDDKFRGKVLKHFFSGDLSRHHFTRPTPGKGRASRLDTNKIITAIGDVITQEAPLLEELAEPTSSSIFAGALLDWAPRLTHLKALVFWDGKMFADENIRNLLHTHCPNLSSLTVYCSTNEDADHHLADFLSGMQPDTLVKFENINSCRVGPETCIALNSHGKSLKSLALNVSNEGVQALALLENCTAIENLELSSVMPVPDLKATQNDVYLSIIAWLKSCDWLEEVSFYNFLSAPDLLIPVLLNGNVRLQKLQINATEGGMYVMKDHHDFHQALSQQRSLRNLLLRADPDPTLRDDKETLMNALCSLTGLRKLTLTRIADFFSDAEIVMLAEYLHDLEELYLGGYGYSDDVFPSLARLRHLKSVSFAGVTRFTESAILDFIDSIGEGQQGLVLSMEFADPDTAITPEGQDLIRDVIAQKIDGRFEYQLLRDPNIPEFDGSDDSD